MEFESILYAEAEISRNRNRDPRWELPPGSGFPNIRRLAAKPWCSVVRLRAPSWHGD